MKSRQINPAFFQQSKQNQIHQQASHANFLKKKFQQARSEGTLNLSSCQPPLQALPQEVFQLEAYLEENEKFWELEPLKALDFSFNQITTVPDEIQNLKDIYSVKGRNNNLSPSLPVAIFTQCTLLRHIDFSYNKLVSIPPEICYLTDLKELILSNNALQSIPREVLGLQSLRLLDLSHNALTALPGFVRTLPALTHLNLSYNKLTSLPANMELFITNIEQFQCTHNQLSMFVSCEEWSSLKQLDISQNQLTALPSLPAQKHNQLTHLIVSYNRITTIPVETCMNCWQLNEFLIHNNQLKTLPLEMECLEQLKVLDISNNNLSDVPHTVGYMKALQILKLEGNCLRTIRQALVTKPANDIKAYLRTRGESILADKTTIQTVEKAMQNMQGFGSGAGNGEEERVLAHEVVGRAAPKKVIPKAAAKPALLAREVEQMQLEVLPEGITSLEALQTIQLRLRDVYDNNGQLNLSSLSLTTVPPYVFEELRTLSYASLVTTIDLSHNQFTELPSFILSLSILTHDGIRPEQWKSINLAHNALHQSRPLNVDNPTVKRLQEYGHLSFDFSSNGLTARHVHALCCLFNMQAIQLNYNPINILPGSINNQSNLKTLKLAYCSLTSILALNFQSLPALEYLDLSNNKIAQLPTTIACARNLNFLSLENNEFHEIPVVLGGLKALKTLLIQGNPQRLIRYTVITQGSAKVIEWLRNKLDPKLLESMLTGPVASYPVEAEEEITSVSQCLGGGSYSGYGNNSYSGSSGGSNSGRYEARANGMTTVNQQQQPPPPVPNQAYSQYRTPQNSLDSIRSSSGSNKPRPLTDVLQGRSGNGGTSRDVSYEYPSSSAAPYATSYGNPPPPAQPPLYPSGDANRYENSTFQRNNSSSGFSGRYSNSNATVPYGVDSNPLPASSSRSSGIPVSSRSERAQTLKQLNSRRLQ